MTDQKKKIMLFASAGVILVAVVVIIILLSSSSKTKDPAQDATVKEDTSKTVTKQAEADITPAAAEEDDEEYYESNGQVTESKIKGINLTLFDGKDCTCEYTGEFNKSGEMDGQGELKGTYVVGENGEVTVNFILSGTFDDGLPKGQGTSYEDFGSGISRTYTGNFENGMWNGEGTLEQTLVAGDLTGTSVKGNFVDGYAVGKATAVYTYKNGNKFTYKGEMANGYPNGKGKMTEKYAEGGSMVTEGTFVNGQADGKCVRTEKTPKGTKDSPNLREKVIDGEFKENMPNGKCSMSETDKDGNVCYTDGTFVNGKVEGTGSSYAYNVDGTTVQYEGGYADDTINGMGVRTVTFVSGDYTQMTETGNFVKGQLDGNSCSLVGYGKDGSKTVMEGTFSNGQFISGSVSKFDKNGKLIGSGTK
ncbi:MAG: hypothetical protein K6G24_09535 [Lachnospiraceae bacterium]|nr:hypothetical protein [Lachnospiraceae bacterium]